MTPRLADLWKPLIARVLVVVLAGIVSIWTAQPAWACSCGSWTDEEAIEQADAAFSGTLVEVTSTTGGDVVRSSADPERFVFDVQDVFKGAVTATQTIVTPVDGASCGLEISGPGPYLVFAYDDSSLTSGAREGEFYSHLCSGTRALADGELAIDLAPTPPIAAQNAPATSAPSVGTAAAVTDDGENAVWLPVAVGAGVLALSAAGIWWLGTRTPGRRET